MIATGIHTHPGFKLGLKPIPAGRPLLKLDWFEGKVPQYEPAVDRLSSITIGLDGNDRFGVCGPTSVDNHRRITTKFLTGAEVDATQDQVFDLYRRSGNPDFDPATDADDNGVDMATMLSAVLETGFAGHKGLAYAQLANQSDASIFAAIDLFGCVLFGVDLEVAQQSQSQSHGKAPEWDYSRSPVWGGHAVVAGAYDSRTAIVTVGSWATAIKTTAAFRKHQLSQAFVLIWRETLSNKRFRQDVDIAALKADFRSLTGKTLATEPEDL